MNLIKRGDIFWANLGVSEGSEQRGTRPVLIIQNDIGNEHSPTVIVASITDSKKHHVPTHVSIGAKETGINKDSVILLEQIRTIDKRKLSTKITSLSEAVMWKVDMKLKISMGLIPIEEFHRT